MRDFIKTEDLTDSDWLAMAVSSPLMYTYIVENVNETYKLYCLVSDNHYKIYGEHLPFIIEETVYLPLFENNDDVTFVYATEKGLYSRVLQPSQVAFTRS